MPAIRWGILGTGNIAAQFARGLAELDDATLVAVGSRTPEAAAAFGQRFGAARAHGSYAALANDPDVDAIYVATPHPFHKDNTLLCLSAGKAVLCEKPFAINAGEAAEMIASARARGVFLMEAMWTRFLPHMVRLRELLAAGVIGEVRMLQADFGFRTGFDPRGRLFDPALGGGALLDVGIYPASLASMVFGAPERIAGMAHLGATGVDEQSAMIFGYAGGQLALLSQATRTNTPHEALLLGTAGRIRVHGSWWKAASMTLSLDGQPDERIDTPSVGNGYNYEAAEVGRCLRAGLAESATMPLDETLAIMRTLDEVRAQWGLRYPGE
ncbi:MAG TPA: Gfo/Idh/MocA family oxidoreductase [Kouleothrix sp.]|uniref:Gfo/Idh/MocA family protein n=1 Tax=Kouleothrix sp. TaxID=2779161 RepID=UPI002C388511|nr:Gfo/Idh/MocA family oxidoreductase [Kouleothrix sp.]